MKKAPETFISLGMKEPVLEWANEWLKKPKALYINGRWINPTGDTFKSVNPATGEILCELKGASKEEVDLAVSAAREAFNEGVWKNDQRLRMKALLKIGELVEKHQDELATLESLDNGMLYRESFGFNTEETIKILEYYAGWTDKLYGEQNPVDEGVLSITVREPVGVCGQIVPWNLPLLMAAWKIAPAIAMGNTVVLKPSSATSLSVIRLFEIIHEANVLPPGVINLIIGSGSVGGYITRHLDIDKISFTGSTATGKQLVHDSAVSNLKTLTLELGGKSPNLVFDDVADLDKCLARSFSDLFSLKGEKCAAPTRMFVQRGVYETVLKKLQEMADSYVCGDPFDPAAQQGPQTSETHMESVLRYIEIGTEEGARVIAGGKRDTSADNKNGYFVRPTILADVKNNMRVAQEEIFGPVLCVIPFETEEEAVSMANDVIYGLAAGLWTKNINKAHRVAEKLDAGMVFINNFNMYHLSSPFGGVKQSGWGREFGIHSLEAYTKLKTIWIDYRE